MTDEERNESQAESPAPAPDSTDARGEAGQTTPPQEPAAPPADESGGAPQAAGEAVGGQQAGRAASPERQGGARREQQPSRQRGRRGQRGERGERGAPDEPGSEIDDTVVKIYRCAAVVKGGRRFSFAALVVAGDRKGRVGIGYGKANEVPSAVEKASKAARRSMRPVRLTGTTIAHQVSGRFGASKVTMLPAGEGTGVIAGATVRAVLELAGVKDVLTKSHGSTSPKNLVKATFNGLMSLQSKQDIERLRGVTLG